LLRRRKILVWSNEFAKCLIWMRKKRQKTNRSFHLTAWIITESGQVNFAWLRFRVNNDAVIDRVHIRQAPGPQSSSPLIYDSGKINITGQDTKLSFNLPDEQCKGPLVRCVHVTFQQNNGEVVLSGAGGWFEEWT